MRALTGPSSLVHVVSILINEVLSQMCLCFCRLSGSYEALNVGLIGDAMDDIIGGLTESYCLAPGEDQGMRPPPDLDDILIKAFDRRSLITARIKASDASSPNITYPLIRLPELTALH